MQNFGQLNETFKHLLASSIANKDGVNAKRKKIFREYIKTVKENKILKTQFQIYSKLENKTENEPSIFVDECISVLRKIGKDKITENNLKLVDLLTKNDTSIFDGDYEFKSLHEHISRLAFAEKNTKNLDNIIESKLFITGFVNENPSSKKVDKTPIYKNKVLIPNLKIKFHEKYKNLTESDKKLFKFITTETKLEEKKDLFENMVWEAIDLVNGKLKECSIDEKDKLLQVKEKLLRYEFAEEQFVSELVKINKLKNNLI
jgi:hypothetical protein